MDVVPRVRNDEMTSFGQLPIEYIPAGEEERARAKLHLAQYSPTEGMAGSSRRTDGRTGRQAFGAGLVELAALSV